MAPFIGAGFIGVGRHPDFPVVSSGGLWTPAEIATSAWFDASDTSTITESGGLVSQWADKGTTASEHLVQGTGANQMSTGLQTMNGLNVLSSTVASKSMQNLTFPVPASGNLTLSFVARIDGQTTHHASLVSMDAGADWQLAADNASRFDGALHSSNLGSSVDTLSGGPYTGPNIWVIVFDKDNSVKKIYVDGVERSSGTYTDLLSPIQKLSVFANRSGSQYVYGLFGEMIIHEDVSSNQRQINEGYLAWKWGLESSLPVDHPYKDGAPTA